MKFTKFGHSCFLIEEGQGKVLVDPGSFSEGFESLTDLHGVLITHEHADHLVIDNLKQLLKTNPELKIYADEKSWGQIKGEDLDATVVHAGDTFELGGVGIEAIGTDHAVIHPNFPTIPNVGYLFGNKLFFPGDALTLPGREVKVLAIPAVAPWSKVSETIDYLLAVKPKIAIPVHDAIATTPEMYAQMLGGLAAPAGIEIRVAEPGVALDL